MDQLWRFRMVHKPLFGWIRQWFRARVLFMLVATEGIHCMWWPVNGWYGHWASFGKNHFYQYYLCCDNICIKFHDNPSNSRQRHFTKKTNGVTGGKVKGLPKSWVPWRSVQISMAIHLIVVEIFQSEPKQQSNIAISRAKLIMWLITPSSRAQRLGFMIRCILPFI